MEDGRRIDFWYDMWITDIGPLHSHMITDHFIPDHVSVTYMIDSMGDWVWDILQTGLPVHVLLRLTAIQRPRESFPMDLIGWKLWDDMHFSVKSAYHARCRKVSFTVDPVWKVIH
ncbi:hypothetical protein V6N13_147666 [Hibiscus sabdariffa]